MSHRALRVSVVLCTYQGRALVGEQLASILEQTRPPDEIIVSDDASTDGTPERVAELARGATIPVRIERAATNRGHVRNFEQTIGLATGEIVFLSDQDDVWFERKIETMVSLFETRPEVGLVYSDAVVVDQELRPDGRTLFAVRGRLGIGQGRSAGELMRGVGVKGCTLAFRAALAGTALPVPEGWGHDHWLVLIAQATTEVVVLAEPLMFYRWTGDNVSRDPFLRGGRLAEWHPGAASLALAVYEEDCRRWEAAVTRLRQLADLPADPPAASKLESMIDAATARLDLARWRARIRRRGPLARLLPVARRLAGGDYHRWLRGARSAARDLIAW